MRRLSIYVVQPEASMTSLEQIVLPLEQSRSLVEHGVVLDTAMVWIRYSCLDGSYETWHPQERIGQPELNMETAVPAPVLSELLDAIRARVGNPLEERTIILSQDEHLEVSCCAGIRSPQGKYQIAYNDTDLLAAYALLREVSR